VLYDSILRHITTDEDIDRVSTAGFALGYAGGGVLLGVVVALILSPHTFGLGDAGAAVRLSFILVGTWWLAFTVPLLVRVPEPPVTERPPGGAVVGTIRQLWETLTELVRFRHAAVFLAAFLLYSDGIGTIIRMAVVYGKEIGLGRGALIGAVLVVQIIGIPCTFGFGQIAQRFGAKPALYFTLFAYICVSVLGFFMTSAIHFFILAGIVGMVQGGCQALSRSLFATLIPRQRAAEFFGLFSVSSKLAGIVGPFLFAVAIMAFGSSRAAILSVIVFFVAGALLLLTVDVEAGKRAALTAEAQVPS
ncbi:MAG TPA: MFS transporter, partial [Kofleriaceae bacterium]|nr:MFS transporter [Kofleriaceae bacterium]